LDKLAIQENFYLQKYLPLLNSVFSSSITENAINNTLKSKLEDLKRSNYTDSFKYRVPIYAYNVDEKGINRYGAYFNSIQDASLALGINNTSLSQYRDTFRPYRGKLICTKPIEDYDKAFEDTKRNTPQGLINRVIPIKI
jgi:hypothetical protein